MRESGCLNKCFILSVQKVCMRTNIFIKGLCMLEIFSILLGWKWLGEDTKKIKIQFVASQNMFILNGNNDSLYANRH